MRSNPSRFTSPILLALAALAVLAVLALGCGSPTGGVLLRADSAVGSGGFAAPTGAGGVRGTPDATASGGVEATGGNSPIGGTTGRGGVSTVTTTGAGGRALADASPGDAKATDGKVIGGATSTGDAKASGGASGGSTGTSTSAPIAGATVPGDGCTPPSAYANLFVQVSGHTQADSDAKVAAGWSKLFTPSGAGSLYFNGPGSDESYVKDTYNNDVRTEGMGYGLMIAVQLDHQTEFDRMWTWVRNHMASGCSSSGCTGKQIAWHCSTSGSVLSSGGAPDGDEYFAAALVFAAKRWGTSSGKYNYATEAQWVLNLIRTQDFNTTYHLVRFYSGSDNGQTDASYVLPAFYQTWACFDTANAAFWNSAVTAARAYFKAGADANGQFGDQSAYDGTKQVSTGVDKIRVPVNIMMDWNFFAADTWQKDTFAPACAAHEKNAGANAEGFCASTLAFGLSASSAKTFVDKLWSAGIPTSYWDGTLYMLALLHVSGTFQLWY